MNLYAASEYQHLGKLFDGLFLRTYKYSNVICDTVIVKLEYHSMYFYWDIHPFQTGL